MKNPFDKPKAEQVKEERDEEQIVGTEQEERSAGTIVGEGHEHPAGTPVEPAADDEVEQQETDTLAELIWAAQNLQRTDAESCNSHHIHEAEELVVEKARALNA